MTPQAIQQLQVSLGLPATGIFDPATSAAMTSAVSKSLSTNQDATAYSGANDPTAVLNAYMTGDWSGVTSLSGKPFTDAQQQAAVQQAQTALAPAYDAAKVNDTADVTASLQKNQEGLTDYQKSQAKQFGLDKNALDQNAATQGVLFSGARVQKQNALSANYNDAATVAARNTAENAAATARGYQYGYGNDAVGGLKSLYSTPGASTYNAGVAGGQVTPGSTLSSVYDASKFNYQGTKPVAQTAAIQTRAAGLLANKANKLSMSGIGAKF